MRDPWQSPNSHNSPDPEDRGTPGPSTSQRHTAKGSTWKSCALRGRGRSGPGTTAGVPRGDDYRLWFKPHVSPGRQLLLVLSSACFTAMQNATWSETPPLSNEMRRPSSMDAPLFPPQQPQCLPPQQRPKQPNREPEKCKRQHCEARRGGAAPPPSSPEAPNCQGCWGGWRQ